MRYSLSVVLAVAPLALAPAADPAPAPSPKAARRPVTDRANLGVQLRPARPGAAEEGVLVNYVYPGAAAGTMGLRPGDEILEMNGIKVTDRTTMIRELGRQEIGSPIRLRVRRGAEEVSVSGAMGSFQKTREAFLAHCRDHIIGKPFSTAAAIEWPDGIDGIKAMRGKVGVVASIDSCAECVTGNWARVTKGWNRAQKYDETWVARCAIFSGPDLSFEENRKGRESVLVRAPWEIPFGIARYPGDRLPLDSLGKDPLIQSHGIAIVDPDGNVAYLEIPGFEPDNYKTEFIKALDAAVQKLQVMKGMEGRKAAPRDGAGAGGTEKR